LNRKETRTRLGSDGTVNQSIGETPGETPAEVKEKFLNLSMERPARDRQGFQTSSGWKAGRWSKEAA